MTRPSEPLPIFKTNAGTKRRLCQAHVRHLSDDSVPNSALTSSKPAKEAFLMKNAAILAAATMVLGLGFLATPAVADTSPTVAQAPPGCAAPTFANGLAQSVFSADSSTWVRGEAWVQTHDDSDHDGKP